MIDLSVTATDDDTGMTLGELHRAVERCLDAGADPDGPVRVNVSRLHAVRRIEVEFEQPAPTERLGVLP